MKDLDGAVEHLDVVAGSGDAEALVVELPLELAALLVVGLSHSLKDGSELRTAGELQRVAPALVQEADGTGAEE